MWSLSWCRAMIELFDVIHLPTAQIVLHNKSKAQIGTFFETYHLTSLPLRESKDTRTFRLTIKEAMLRVGQKNGEIFHEVCEFEIVPCGN